MLPVAAAASAASAADADVRAGNIAGAGVQAKNDDNTKAAATVMMPECTEQEGCRKIVGEEGGHHSGYFLSQRT